MLFRDRYHFKNYVRKIALCAKIDYQTFDRYLADHFYQLFDFTIEHHVILNHVGIGEVIKYTAHEIRRVDRNDPQARHVFMKACENSHTLLQELMDFVTEYASKICLNEHKKLFNYLEMRNWREFVELKRMFRELNKYANAYRGNLIPSPKFIEFTKYLTGRYGIYFLYNLNKELLYIGKSVSVGDRITSSIWEKKAVDGFVRVAFPKTKAEMHVYEPYYVATEKPKLNREFSDGTNLSFELPELDRTDYVKIFDSVSNSGTILTEKKEQDRVNKLQ